MSSTPPTRYKLRVTPDDKDIIKQIMFYGDSVHAIPDLETLLNFRISGEEDSNRQAYASVVDLDGKRIVGATVFTHLSTADITLPSQNFLYGKIQEIKTTPAARLVEPANLMTCYSICSYGLPPEQKALFPNPGRHLIKSVYAERNSPDFVVSTCSPIRSTKDFLKAAGLENIEDPEVLKLCVAAHLKQRQPYTPQSFHMTNGAYAGAIHTNFNNAGGMDNVNGIDLTLGYRYARNELALASNLADWNNGKIPASSHVRAMMRSSDELVASNDLRFG